jgi:hypothetical protein
MVTKMSAKQYMTKTHYGVSEYGDMTRVPSDDVTRERAARKWQLLMAAFVAVACAMIGVQFLT